MMVVKTLARKVPTSVFGTRVFVYFWVFNFSSTSAITAHITRVYHPKPAIPYFITLYLDCYFDTHVYLASVGVSNQIYNIELEISMQQNFRNPDWKITSTFRPLLWEIRLTIFLYSPPHSITVHFTLNNSISKIFITAVSYKIVFVLKKTYLK